MKPAVRAIARILGVVSGCVVVVTVVLAYAFWEHQRRPAGVLELRSAVVPSARCNDSRFDLATFELQPVSLRQADPELVWGQMTRAVGYLVPHLHSALNRVNGAPISRVISRAHRELEIVRRHFFEPEWLEFRFRFELQRPSLTQDLTLALPDEINQREKFELACKTHNDSSERLLFRREMRPVLTKNQTFTVPMHCVTERGEIDINIHEAGLLDRDLPSVIEKYLGILRRSTVRALTLDTSKKIAYDGPAAVYASRMSYRPGEQIDFRVHSLVRTEPNLYTIEIFRAGKNVISVFRSKDLVGRPAEYSPLSFRFGLDWPVSFTFTVPKDWQSGYYYAIARNADGEARFPIIVAPPRGDQTGVAVIAETNTWQAYNPWGGGSFYSYDLGACVGIEHSRTIAMQRPFAVLMAGGPVFPDSRLAEWLERENIPYVVYDDKILDAEPSELDNHRIVALASHPEYYTEEMYRNLERYMTRGGNLLALGGNVIATRVTLTGRQMEKHEDGLRHDLDGRFGGEWSAHLGRSPARLVGLEYDSAGYNTRAPYVVRNADHPVFAGTGLSNGARIGYQASGIETDKISKASPPGLSSLAKGANPDEGGADMVMFDHNGGGKVFAVGSIAFLDDLLEDRTLTRIVRNALNLMRIDTKLLPVLRPNDAQN